MNLPKYEVQTIIVFKKTPNLSKSIKNFLKTRNKLTEKPLFYFSPIIYI
jgi:hypothetical protein